MIKLSFLIVCNVLQIPARRSERRSVIVAVKTHIVMCYEPCRLIVVT